MGEVWEGTHVELGTRVALKVLRRDALRCDEMVARFAREAHLLARIQSEHVVRVIDYLPKSRHGPVIVMELLDGPTLADVLQRDRLSVEVATHVAFDVLRGLAAMHECGVIHRDVKPANIVLRRAADGTRRAVLVDLGVGRCVTDPSEEISVADRVVGTFEYMAPEQVLSSHTASEGVDLYAVGAVLFRAVSGAHPFPDKHGVDVIRAKLHEQIPTVSTGRSDAVARRFEASVSRALAFDASDRFPSALAFAAALGALHEDAQLPMPQPEPRRRLGRRRAAVLIAAVSAATFAACTVDDVPANEPPAALLCR
jgi:serine/threonine protein kinase